MQNLKKDLSRTLPASGNQPKNLQEYYQQLKQTRCGDHFFLKQTLDIWELFSQWKSTGNINAAIKCRKCGASRCAGCQMAHKGPSRRVKTLGSVKVDYCCDRGLLFVIWALLCGLDCIITNQKITVSSPPLTNPYAGAGMGLYGYGDYYDMMEMWYGSANKDKGTGYGGGGRMSAAQTAAALANTPEDQKDMIIGDALAVITELLSSSDGPTDSLVLKFLAGSTILERVAELLRNDSMTNVTQRHTLYQRVLNFVRTLATHPKCSAPVLRQRYLKQSGISGQPATLYSMCQGKADYNKNETNPPVCTYLKNLSTQAQVIIKAAQSNPNEYRSREGQMQVALCRQIVDLARTISPKLASSTPQGQSLATYIPLAQYHKEHCCEEIDDNVMVQNYSLYTDAAMTYATKPGRMKKLVEQVANLKTSLPPGIFIRHASSRPDMLKALIIGPVDTPYENGLFEFDIFCPMDYPYGPPRVKHRTTGGGRVSFNPNLYSDGKVCLSLLGTFAGQPWIPNQSTLLQVLVSIQSMIFCDKPFFNEPGNEHRPNVQQTSRRYNSTIHASTMYHAMIEWMNNCERSIWKDVIIKHFVEQAPKVMGASQRWSREANSVPSSGSWMGMHNVFDDGIAMAKHSPGDPHANPYSPKDVQKAAQQLNGVISQFLKKYGRH